MTRTSANKDTLWKKIMDICKRLVLVDIQIYFGVINTSRLGPRMFGFHPFLYTGSLMYLSKIPWTRR